MRKAAVALIGVAGVTVGALAGVMPAQAAVPTGHVIAWGDNSYGQLAVPAEAQSGIVDISASPWHVLALTGDGGVVAWGDGVFGSTAVPADASAGVSDIAAGGGQSFGFFAVPTDFSLALKDGAVLAWGDNSYGVTNVPAAATAGVTAIAAGDMTAYAVVDGAVVAWGDNTYGQTSVPAAALSGVVDVAAGPGFALALTDAGSVIAWGDGSLGATTVPVEASSGVVAISAGYAASMALKADGSVVSWGLPGYTAPAGFAAGASDVAAGWVHGLAVVDGAVAAFGENSFGQATVPVEAGADVMMVAAGGYASYALIADPVIPTEGTVSVPASDPAVTLTISGADGDVVVDTAAATDLVLTAGDYTVSGSSADPLVSVSFDTASFTVVAGESMTLGYTVTVSEPPVVDPPGDEDGDDEGRCVPGKVGEHGKSGERGKAGEHGKACDDHGKNHDDDGKKDRGGKRGRG